MSQKMKYFATLNVSCLERTVMENVVPGVGMTKMKVAAQHRRNLENDAGGGRRTC
uniref:Uncharacterized protein n=1 Tax=Arion vulgaris TaxID=1028688 RepID=A0A0B7AWN6_9EUPU